MKVQSRVYLTLTFYLSFTLTNLNSEHRVMLEDEEGVGVEMDKL